MEIQISTTQSQEFVDITSEVQKAVTESGLKNGLCHVFVPHTTAGITINENADPDVKKDILKTLNRLIPVSGDYDHSEGNSHSHIKASLMGSSQTIVVKDGKLVLGTWQGVMLCEFDGPRNRKVNVSVLEK